MIVDGRIAFTGGIGLSDTYSLSARSGSFEHGWRDTQIRITGPAAAEFQRVFLDTWKQEVGPIENEASYFPRVRRRAASWSAPWGRKARTSPIC